MSWRWPVVLTLVSVLAAAGAFGLANFGGPIWAFALLFGWMLTIGLPTFAAIVMTSFFWHGVSLWAFATTVLVVATVFQLTALRFVARMLTARRA